MSSRWIFLVVSLLFLVGCQPGMNTTDPSSEDLSSELPFEIPDDSQDIPLSDSKIQLDEFGEAFQKANGQRMMNSRYMEKSCRDITTWTLWQNLPMKWCSYSLRGQNAEVLMLNPGPRRMTMWLQEACSAFADNFSRCMDGAFNHILNQSGGQFPVAGVVIEDMDGNGRGNAYVFRNGVTVQINSISTATETPITALQIAKSFTDKPLKTYSYARPISVTREKLTAYAKATGLTIPELGTSSQAKNIFNEVVGQLYIESWSSNKNHLIRAWIYSQDY